MIDVLPPIEGNVLPPGENQLLFRLVFNVLEAAPLGESSFTFLEKAGDPPVTNELVVESNRVVPATKLGTLTVLPPKEPPPPITNRMEMTKTKVKPGEEGTLELLVSAEKNIDAFTAIFAFDPKVLEMIAVDLSGSDTEAAAPELVAPKVKNELGFVMVTVILDFLPPFDRQTIPAGENRKLFTIHFRAKDEAPPGAYPITLQNQLGDPPLNNILVFGGESFFPELVPGEVEVKDPSGPKFLRGDIEVNSFINVSDPVVLVAYLFKGGPAPPCLEAADSDDNGKLDLTDAVYLLNFLFKDGPEPPPPYPGVGPDPTPDDLGCGS